MLIFEVNMKERKLGKSGLNVSPWASVYGNEL
jgi:hypothetical protein